MTCLIWHGLKNAKGYGRMRIGHREMRAHRAAYQAAHGPIPAGFIVMHTCDTPSCINPDHLVLGTHKDNVADCINKGRRRHATRDTHPFTKLKLSDREAIFQARAGGETIGSLASRYVVARSTMHSFLCRGTDINQEMVGVVGFEPTTTTSRTSATAQKINKYRRF